MNFDGAPGNKYKDSFGEAEKDSIKCSTDGEGSSSWRQNFSLHTTNEQYTNSAQINKITTIRLATFQILDKLLSFPWKTGMEPIMCKILYSI